MTGTEDTNGENEMTATQTKARKNAVVKGLAAAGVKTMADLDRWIAGHPCIDSQNRPYLMSRCSALTILVGEDAAFSMLNELAIRQCC